MKPTIEEMSEIVYCWMLKEKEYFKVFGINKLVTLHNTLGRTVRNYFKLWDYPWVPEIHNNTDFSPEHPDAVSERVIKQAYKLFEQRVL